jgi:tetratricopeptide (TPR) repeat protein
MSLESHARRSESSGAPGWHTRPDSLTHTSAELEPGVEPRTEPGPSSDAERQARLTPGSIIPDTRLEIVRWLGEGGMGSVFEVRHLDIDRHFAVKLLHRSGSVARARRFRREAKTIGNIGSPWIVEIFDFKELPDGRLMYLMELVDGPSLLEQLHHPSLGGALEFGRLLGLARQICKGLSDAHSRGFIHRDIKPENIMLALDEDEREHVKIVDFGLAGLLAQPNESSRAGTPAYMSPEQCKGEPADARTDIYSLGVTLYELATGTLPFVRETADGLREDHVGKQPRPPSSCMRSLPQSFDALVLRCLAKQPEQRFANTAELEAALIELQIELGIKTPWDHLPAPEVDDAHKRELERGLAGLRRDRQRERGRQTLLGLALVSLVAVSSTLGWWVGAEARAEAAAEAEAEVEALNREIRAAADQHHWLHPSRDRPDSATAYRLLLELERLEIDAAADVSRQLRAEIAAQLLSLGDSYWDVDGGRHFAREFYAYALVFDPNSTRAHERAGLSQSAAAALRERAASGDFDAHELAAVAPLTVLAEPDDRVRLGALQAMAGERDRLPTSVAISIDQLIDDLEREHLVTEAPAPTHALGSAPVESETEAAIDEESAASDPEPIALKLSPAEPSPTRASAEANELALAGDSAYQSGLRDEAKRLYQRSLALDGNNLAALIGLHRLSFDRGEFKDALTYAKRAQTLRPKRGDLHVYVGDSCMKVLDYGCARTHYQRAEELGDRQAAQRLRMLDQRLGVAEQEDDR